MPSRRSRRALGAVACAVGLGLGAGACSDGGGTSSDAGQAEQGSGSPRAGLSSYATVAEMAEALTAAGLPCSLEYEGLTDAGKELSLCTIEGEQATLSVWFDPAQLDDFLTSDVGGVGATAVGADWTVDVDSAALAQRVADALGGTVKA